MSDLEDKLGAILSNPDAMNQIMNLAQSLGGGAKQEPPPIPPAPNQDATAAPPAAQSSGAQGQGGDLFSALGQLDPRLLTMAMRMFSEYNSNEDQRAALLNALRPFVKEERYAKLDKAIRISKLTRLIRIALDSFKTKEEGEKLV